MTATPETPTPEITPEVTAAPPEPVKAPPLPYSFKATLKEYRKRIGVARILLAFALTFIFWFRFGPVVWVLSVIALTILIVGILYVLGSRRVTITPDAIEYYGGFGRRHTIRFDEAEGAKVFLNYYEPSFGISPRVSVAQKNGKPLTFTTLYWNVDDLDKLAAVLRDKKVAVEYYDDVATYSMIAKQFPTYATYVERRPIFVATIITIAILVVVTAIAVAITLN